MTNLVLKYLKVDKIYFHLLAFDPNMVSFVIFLFYLFIIHLITKLQIV